MEQSMLEFLHALKRNEARVVWSRSYFAEYGANFDVFYSFCEVGGKIISLHGEMNIETFHERRKEGSKVARLYRCQYETSENGLTQTRKDYIGLGADPRMVSDGENAFAYVIGYGEAGHPAFLYNEQDGTLRPITAPDSFHWGKNWQPFMKNGRLFIVHELSPFSIYEIEPEIPELRPFKSVDSDLDLPAHNTNHTMFRGGGNAIIEGDFIYGVGRASAQSYKHVPFFWSSLNYEFPTIQFTDFFNIFSRKGFNIVDPTSFFKVGDNYYLGLACSETCWFHKQWILNLLIVIDRDETNSRLPSLRTALSPFPDQTIDRKVNLRSHLFHCDRMQHGIPFVREYGVQSTGEPGALVYGPYIEIEEAVRLKVELAYLTLQDQGDVAGTFDINLSRRKPDGEMEFIQIAECALKATDKAMNYVTLYFDTTAYIGYSVEFRVFARENHELNAFHIRTRETNEDFPSNVPDAPRAGTEIADKDENSMIGSIYASPTGKLLSRFRAGLKALFRPRS